MRRGAWIPVVLLLILVGVGAGIGGYNAGVTEGIERSGGEVVRVVGHGYGFGFPFGLILFPLFFSASSSCCGRRSGSARAGAAPVAGALGTQGRSRNGTGASRRRVEPTGLPARPARG